MCRKSFEKTLGGYYIMNENKECMYKKGDCMIQEERPCSEEFLKFLKMPQEVRAHFDPLYSAVLADDQKRVTEIEKTAKEDFTVLMTLVNYLLEVEKEKDAKKSVRERLLSHASAAASVLVLLMDVEAMLSKVVSAASYEKVGVDINSIFYKLSSNEDCGVPISESCKELIKSARFFVDSCELDEEEYKALWELTSQEILVEVQFARYHHSSPKSWKMLYEKYGPEDVDFIKALLQG